MDYAILIISLIVFAIACVLDVKSSIEMTKWGIKESVPLVRDKNGNFSLWRALIFVIGSPAIVLGMFFFGPESEEATGYHRMYAGLFLIPGALLHLYAWNSNNRLIARKKAAKAKAAIDGGGVIR